MYVIKEIESVEIPENFCRLCFGTTENQKELLNREKKHFFLGAYNINQQMIGIITVFQNRGNPNEVVIAKLYVLEKFRKLGIGTQLVSEAEKKAQKLGYKKIICSPKINPFLDFEKIKLVLKKNQWNEITDVSKCFFINTVDIQNQKWFEISLPENYTLITLNKLSSHDKNKLHEQINFQKKNDSKFYNPINIPYPEPMTTVFVKNLLKDKICAWAINEFQNGYICYKLIYIIPEERNKGLFFPMLSYSIRICFQNFKGAWFWANDDNPMMQFALERMMGKACNKTFSGIYAWKTLA